MNADSLILMASSIYGLSVVCLVPMNASISRSIDEHALCLVLINASTKGCRYEHNAQTQANEIETNKYYGETVELKGNYIYFTSWKYVRQGNFGWPIQPDPNAPEAHKQGAWLKGDGTLGARFAPIDMPYGLCLVAQQAQKVPFQPGQMAAQVFDEGGLK